MKYLASKIRLALLILLILTSFGAFKSRPPLNKKTACVKILEVDSFQLLINEYCKYKSTDRKKRDFQKLIVKLRNFTSKINGSKKVVFRNVRYHLFVANLDSDEIQMHLYRTSLKKDNFYTIGEVKKKLDENYSPLMITNAGMFNVDYEPEGLYVEEKSKTYFSLDTGKAMPDANFYLKPNGVFYLDANRVPHIDSTEKLQGLKDSTLQKFKLATQSGPMLVINGTIHRSFKPGSKNLKIRNGIGLPKYNQKKIVFAITRNESNFYDFALFFRDVFNCDNALFLDGTISEMYLFDLSPKELGGSFGPIISVSRRRGY